MRRVAQRARLLLEVLALAAYTLQLIALFAEALVGSLLLLLRCLRARDSRNEAGNDQRGNPDPRDARRSHADPARRCRPTDTALPSSPMPIPTSSPTIAVR